MSFPRNFLTHICIILLCSHLLFVTFAKARNSSSVTSARISACSIASAFIVASPSPLLVIATHLTLQYLRHRHAMALLRKLDDTLDHRIATPTSLNWRLSHDPSRQSVVHHLLPSLRDQSIAQK